MAKDRRPLRDLGSLAKVRLPESRKRVLIYELRTTSRGAMGFKRRWGWGALAPDGSLILGSIR